VHYLNIIAGILVEGLLWPFRSLHPYWGLAAISLATGIFFLMVFKWTSNQEALAVAKGRLKAHLLELRLFRHDMVLTLRAQRDLFLANLVYLRHTLRPILVLIVPVVLLLVQLDARYGVRPLEVGETVLLRVSLDDDALAGGEPRLALPEGLTQDSPPLRIPVEGEVDWRLRASAPGAHRVGLEMDGVVVEKRLRVGGALPALSSRVTRAGFLSLLLDPVANAAERPLPAGSSVRSVSLDYPSRPSPRILGFRVHWLVFFLVLSILPAYAVKGLVGVEV